MDCNEVRAYAEHSQIIGTHYGNTVRTIQYSHNGGNLMLMLCSTLCPYRPSSHYESTVLTQHL